MKKATELSKNFKEDIEFAKRQKKHGKDMKKENSKHWAQKIF